MPQACHDCAVRRRRQRPRPSRHQTVDVLIVQRERLAGEHPRLPAEILRTQLPHSRLDVLPTGHCAWEEAPGQYAGIISEWVNGTYLKV